MILPAPYEPPYDPRFRLVSLQDGSTISFTNYSSKYSIVQYSLDGNSWTNYDRELLTLNNNRSIFFRAKVKAKDGGFNNNGKFMLTGKWAAKGDIIYMYNYENPDNKTLTYTYAFHRMFNTTCLYDAHELVLSPTILASGTYHQLFMNCTDLVYGPSELPALTSNIPGDGYNQIFASCSSMIEAPIIKTLEINFNNNAAYNMFYNCRNLNKIVSYATNYIGYDSTWMRNVAATGDFYNLGNAQTLPYLPSGWSVHTSL